MKLLLLRISHTIGLTDDTVTNLIDYTKSAHQSTGSLTEDQLHAIKDDEFVISLPEPESTPCHYAEPSRRTIINEMIKTEIFPSLVDQFRSDVSDRVIYHAISRLADIREYNDCRVDLHILKQCIKINRHDLYEKINRLTDQLTNAYITKYSHVLDKALTEYALSHEQEIANDIMAHF